MNEGTENGFRQMWTQGKDFLSLKYRYAKLTMVEKLSVTVSMILILMIVAFLGTVCIYLMSVAAITYLCYLIGPVWGYMAMGGFYMLLAIVVVVFRKSLVINPVTRFVTRCFFDS